jgi:hypothetical protein
MKTDNQSLGCTILGVIVITLALAQAWQLLVRFVLYFYGGC